MLPKDLKALSEAKEAARRIQRYTQSITLRDLEANDEKQSAVFWQFIVLGEAVKRLSPEFREENARIPWRDIAGMRDVLAHQYDDILLDIVWSVATTRVPEILAQIDPLLPGEPTTSKAESVVIAADLWSACNMAMQLNEQPKFTVELSQGLVEVTGQLQVIAMTAKLREQTLFELQERDGTVDFSISNLETARDFLLALQSIISAKIDEREGPESGLFP